MSKDNQIVEMNLDGLSADQLEVIVRLALNAEVEYYNNGRPEIADQCFELRNRARRLHKQMEADEANDIRAMYPDDFSEAV